jgi:hypothetical protein
MKLFLSLVLILLQIPRASAEEWVLTASGGVSLGSYEAGVIDHFLRSKRDELPKKLKVAMGASAGSINSLLAIFEACATKPRPEKSLLWDMWIPVGLEQLDARDTNLRSLFKRDAIEPLFAQLRERWSEGFRTDCDVVFGVTVTRQEPLIESIGPGLEIFRQAESFTVRISGRGPGHRPRVENYIGHDVNSYRTTLPLDDAGTGNLDMLLGLIQASSAFPGAFSPFPIRHCLLRPGEKERDCKSSDAREDHFVDGGIYHNGPVGQAYKISQRLGLGEKAEILYINASSPMHGFKERVSPLKNDIGVLEEFRNLFANFMTSGRKFELTRSLEESPQIKKHLRTNVKTFPLVSQPLYAFLGFVETDFRRADYFNGVYDGEKMFGGTSADPTARCYIEHLGGAGATCPLEENLAILARLARERKENGEASPDLQPIFERLDRWKFHFKDLGIEKRDAEYGKIFLKQRLSRLMVNFADRQPESYSSSMKLGVYPAMNMLEYSPSLTNSYFLLGSSPEFGITAVVRKKYSLPTFLRLGTGILLFQNNGQWTFDSTFWSPTPYLSLTIQPSSWGNALWQISAGARLGYILAHSDQGGTRTCEDGDQERYIAACSGLSPQAFVSLTVLERARMQFVFVPGDPNRFNLRDYPAYILQFGMVLPHLFE